MPKKSLVLLQGVTTWTSGNYHKKCQKKKRLHSKIDWWFRH